MDRLGAGGLGRGDDLLPHQIALAGGRRPDQHRLVGLGHMGGVGVSLGIDRHGGDPHPARGAEHPACDLSAIGDKDGLQHGSQRAPARPTKTRPVIRNANPMTDPRNRKAMRASVPTMLVP